MLWSQANPLRCLQWFPACVYINPRVNTTGYKWFRCGEQKCCVGIITIYYKKVEQYVDKCQWSWLLYMLFMWNYVFGLLLEPNSIQFVDDFYWSVQNFGEPICVLSLNITFH